MSLDDNSKVIGYFAIVPPVDVLCEGDACVIAGSEMSMKKYLSTLAPNSLAKFQVKKTRFGEILEGMQRGAPYAFDEASYNRFYPIANKNGFDLQQEDFSVPTETGRHFVVIRPGGSIT